MRFRTTVVVFALVVALAGAIVVGLGALSGGESAGSLSVLWTSDTARDTGANHHAVAAGHVRGQPVVYAPISGQADTTACDLVALNGSTGASIWHYQIPPANCTIHSVADPVIADYDRDGVKEVLVPTTQEAILGFSPLNGTLEFRYNLSEYGYPQPIVTDFVGDDTREIIVMDVNGVVYVLRPNETAVWTRKFDSYMWADPEVRDFTADGTPELAVGIGQGKLALLDQDGTIVWTQAQAFSGSVTWMAVGPADDDPAVEIAAATTDGNVVLIDGRTGSVQWTRDLGAYAAVDVLADGDGDGQTEVYAVARDGKLRAIDAQTGEIEWTTTLTTEDVQMTPPPRLGNVDGDNELELVAVTNNGLVSVVDPSSGAVRASYERNVAIWEHPELADIDGDNASEILVIYADGRVVALSYG